MDPMTIAFLVIGILVAGYLYVKWKYSYWNRRGLESLKPEFFYGNVKTLIKKQLSVRDVFYNIYKEIKSRGLRHGGFYMFLGPVYMPIDIELVKHILQNDFSHFVNHGNHYNEKTDPLTGHLFNLENEKWRNLRSKLTPTFTTGKLKMMFETLVFCTTGLKEILDEYRIVQDPVEIKDVVSRYTTDIIGSCAFGIDCNSLKNPDSEFRKFGNKIFEELGALRRILIAKLPKKILNLFHIKMLKQDIEDFFMNVVKDTVKFRETNNIHRKDFMHLMLQLKNKGTVSGDENIVNTGSEKLEPGQSLTINELAAQCFVFFIAGYETSATTMTFALFELAQNQNIQDKLREEITTILKNHEGQMSYDAIMEMKYLDKVVHETLRKYPPLSMTTRVCNKRYQVPGTNVVLEPGTRVMIPIHGIQSDPDNYPDPQKFDPERFTEENKAKRSAFTFLPFGEGPRLCIGARFGLMQTKVGLVTIIKNFKVTLNQKTKMPLKYDTKLVVSAVEGGVWLNVASAE